MLEARAVDLTMMVDSCCPKKLLSSSCTPPPATGTAMHRNSGEKSPSVANIGVRACRYQTARPAGFTAWLTLLELVLQASMLEHVGMVQGIHNIQLLLELMGDEGVCSTNGAHIQFQS
jgi:hypothetical protein